MISAEKEIKSLLQDVLSAHAGKNMGIGISCEETGSTRFAENAISTNGVYNKVNVFVEVAKGKKKGLTTVNQLNPEKINEAVEKADKLADISPENEESMPLLGPQNYPVFPRCFFPATAGFSPTQRTDAIAAVIERAKKEKLNAFGFFETYACCNAYMNSRKLFYYQANSRSSFSNTMRGTAGGSGWAAGCRENVDQLNIGELAERAIRIARDSQNFKALPAGKYTVILEPAAVADLVWFLLYNFTAREADEGRNFLALQNGRNRLGQKLVSPVISIVSDPFFTDLPASPIGEDGLPQGKTVWINKGVVQNLSYTRFWAEKKNKLPVGFPANLIMSGQDHTLEELIKSTRKGVLVSRLWYIRDLNPMILLLTGLTRDGVFLIENGKISHPVNNFRFNESPVNVLKNVEMMTRAVRATGGETGQDAYVPALKVKDFNFASVSEAV